jgi:hypothetical protein
MGWSGRAPASTARKAGKGGDNDEERAMSHRLTESLCSQGCVSRRQ